MNPAVYDERQHLASLVRDKNHVTALRLGIFGIDLPQYDYYENYDKVTDKNFKPLRMQWLLTKKYRP